MSNPYQQMPQMPAPPLAQPPLPAPAVPAKTTWMPLIIGANVLFVIIVVLILIFALRR
jgi:hypothetical protein